LGGGWAGSSVGESRLVNGSGSGGGFKLGGRGHTTRAGIGTNNRDELRKFIARAAESRQKQMQQIRRTIERSKEPCVIEIFDDDDDDDDDDDACNKDSIGNMVLGRRKSLLSNKSHSSKRFKSNKNTNDPIPEGQRKRISNGEECVIDLTTNNRSTSKRNGFIGPKSNRRVLSSDEECVIDLTTTNNSPTARMESWSCGRCTYKNRPGTACCNVCLGQR